MADRALPAARRARPVTHSRDARRAAERCALRLAHARHRPLRPAAQAALPSRRPAVEPRFRRARHTQYGALPPPGTPRLAAAPGAVRCSPPAAGTGWNGARSEFFGGGILRMTLGREPPMNRRYSGSHRVLTLATIMILPGCMQSRVDESRELHTQITKSEAVVILPKPPIEGAAARGGFVGCIGRGRARHGATGIAVPGH